MTQFEGDDGTLAYARAAGIYLDGVEAPIFPERILAQCPFDLSGAAVIFSFGQSNAANTGDGRYTASNRVAVFNVFDMNFYSAADPLPGASNDGGSVWGRLGDQIVASGLYKSVLLVPIAVGGTFIREWAPGGASHRRLMFALQRLKMANIAASHICWHQGEADANLSAMTAETYASLFRLIAKSIRDVGVQSPIFVSLATLCATADHPFKNREQIRAGQKRAISSESNLLPGPDTDKIGLVHRRDGCHFNESGLERCAKLWMSAIAASRLRRHLVEIRYHVEEADMNPVKALVLKLIESSGYMLLKKSDYRRLAVAPALNPIAIPGAHTQPAAPPVQMTVAEGWTNYSTDLEFVRIYSQFAAKSRLGATQAYAIYTAARHISKTGLAGDIVDCGDGSPTIIAIIAATLASLGDTNRKLTVFDITGDPTHRGDNELPLWGGTSNLLGGKRYAVRRPVEPLPDELASSGYPVEKLSIVRFPVGIPDFSRQLALLAVTPETYSANISAISNLLEHLAPGGIVAARGQQGLSQRHAIDDAIDHGKSPIVLWPITSEFRIGMRSH